MHRIKLFWRFNNASAQCTLYKHTQHLHCSTEVLKSFKVNYTCFDTLNYLHLNAFTWPPLFSNIYSNRFQYTIPCWQHIYCRLCLYNLIQVFPITACDSCSMGFYFAFSISIQWNRSTNLSNILQATKSRRANENNVDSANGVRFDFPKQ